MSTEHTSSPEQPRRKPANRPALFAYMVALFAVAFLLLLMSYFMQQRRSDQLEIEGLQKNNTSALQITKSVQEQNQTLRQQVAELEAENETLAAQAEEQSKTAQALDWLWRIQREYFQKRYSSVRQMIREFEDGGLKDFLPAESITNPEYRSPMEQYEAIYDSVF